MRRDRIDIAEIVDVLAEGRAQLVELAVSGAGAEQHLEAKTVFPRLPQEQGDVGIVAGMRNDLGAGALDLGHQRGQIGGGGRIALLEHDLKPSLLGIRLVCCGNAASVGAILVNQRNLDVPGLDAELGLGVFGDETRESLAVLIGVNLGAKDIMQIPVLEHRGCNRGRDPEDFLLLLDPGRERNRVRARKNPLDDVELFLIDQALDLVDRNVGLAL